LYKLYNYYLQLCDIVMVTLVTVGVITLVVYLLLTVSTWQSRWTHTLVAMFCIRKAHLVGWAWVLCTCCWSLQAIVT